MVVRKSSQAIPIQRRAIPPLAPGGSQYPTSQTLALPDVTLPEFEPPDWSQFYDLDRCPYYHLVPKTLKGNLEFRLDVLKHGQSSKRAAHELWMMCSRDMLFFVNTFCWIYEPRKPDRPVVPFITYEYQDQALLDIEEAIGNWDLCVKKSRDMGATWDCLTAFEWRWQFHPMQSFLVVSRTEPMVDKADDPDCLFWKLEFLIDKQPSFLRPHKLKTQLRLKNEDNGSTINGASTTGNVGRGGRRTAVMIDEYAAFPIDDGYRALNATQAVTDTRLWNSTPQGTGNAYHDVAHDKNIKQIVMHWSLHPVKRLGLYTSEKGKLVLLDKEYEYPSDYEFILDGKVRSPYYDKECKRTPIPQLIAQELDMDFLGSNFQFFDKNMLDRHEKQHCMLPYHLGELDFEKETCVPGEFIETAKGRLKLWISLDAEGRPPRDKEGYAFGADVSAGTGASNSCLSFGRISTGEKVAEFVSPHVSPDELAKVAVALGQWFCNDAGRETYLVPEANGGHNRSFIKRCMALGHKNIYFRRNEQALSKKVTDVPGWGSTRDNKRELLEEYSRALQDGEFLNRSTEAIAECREYVFMPDGSIDHARSRNAMDPSGARENHGDRTMADALTWLGMGKMSRAISKRVPEVPPNCIEGRRVVRAALRKQRSWY